MDITMCQEVTCSKKETCLRFKGEANKYQQSYFLGSPLNKETNECDFYYEIKETTSLIEKDEMKQFTETMLMYYKEFDK